MVSLELCLISSQGWEESVWIADDDERASQQQKFGVALDKL